MNENNSDGANNEVVHTSKGPTIKRHLFHPRIRSNGYYSNFRYQKVLQAGYSIRFDCIETVLEWIPRWDVIIGCQYYLTHPSVLHALSKKTCHIVVQYHSWMDHERQRKVLGTRKNFALIKRSYPKLDNLYKGVDIRDALFIALRIPGPKRGLPELIGPPFFGQNLCSLFEGGLGIGVYRHRPRLGQYEKIMHHKFLLGIRRLRVGEKASIGYDQNYEGSLLYGSFNMSVSAKDNLESILVIEDPFYYLYGELLKEFSTILLTGSVTNWSDFIETPQFKKNDRDYPEVILPE